MKIRRRGRSDFSEFLGRKELKNEGKGGYVELWALKPLQITVGGRKRIDIALSSLGEIFRSEGM